MSFKLTDLNQAEEQNCEIKMNINGADITTTMTLKSAMSQEGVDAREAYREKLKTIISDGATEKAMLSLEVDLASVLAVGWPAESDEFFGEAYSLEALTKILNIPAYGILRKAIIEASSLSENFICLGSLKP